MNEPDPIFDSASIWVEGVGRGFLISVIPLFMVGVAIGIGLIIIRTPIKVIEEVI